MSEFKDDVKQALNLAQCLTELRASITLNNLYFTQEMLKAIKGMPKLAPPARPIKLSEIAPAIMETEEETEEKEEAEKPKFFARVKEKLKRRLHV